MSVLGGGGWPHVPQSGTGTRGASMSQGQIDTPHPRSLTSNWCRCLPLGRVWWSGPQPRPLCPSGLGQLLVWEWQSESYVLKQQGHFNSMVTLAYSPDGQYIVTGGDDGKVGCATWNGAGPWGGSVAGWEEPWDPAPVVLALGLGQRRGSAQGLQAHSLLWAREKAFTNLDLSGVSSGVS